MTFEAYAKEIREAVFPDGEADNLIDKHNQQVADALCDLQRSVKCLRDGNQTRWRQSQTRYLSGTSAVVAPPGVVSSVKTVSSGNANDIITYERVAPDQFHHIVSRKPCPSVPDEDKYPMALTRASLAGGASAPMDIAAYPQGRNEQNKGCRKQGGIWTVKRSDIHVWPSIDSNELLVAFWEGVATSWDPEDEMPERMLERSVRRAVELFLEAEAARFETESLKDFQATSALYGAQRRDLILWCRRQRVGEYGSEEA